MCGAMKHSDESSACASIKLGPVLRSSLLASGARDLVPLSKHTMELNVPSTPMVCAATRGESEAAGEKARPTTVTGGDETASAYTDVSAPRATLHGRPRAGKSREEGTAAQHKWHVGCEVALVIVSREDDEKDVGADVEKDLEDYRS